MNKTFWAAAFYLVLISPAKADQSYYSETGQIRISGLNPSESSISIRNIGDTAVDLAGWAIYDENDTHELFLTEPDIIRDDAGGGLMLGSQTEITITGKNDNDFRLYNAGGEVRLFSGPVEIDGTLQDRVNYPAIAEGESYPIIDSPQDQTSEENSNDNSVEDSNENPSDSAAVSDSNNTDNTDHDYQIPENPDSEPAVLGQDNRAVQKENSNSKSAGVAGEKEKSAMARQGREVPDPAARTTGNNAPNVNGNNNQDVPAFTASSQLEKSPWGWFYWLYYSWFLRRIILPLLVLWLALYVVVYLLRRKLNK